MTKTWYMVTMLFILVGFSATRASYIPEPDVLWGARNGLAILNGGSITHPLDMWNFTTLGEQWSPNSWLWNVFISLFAYSGGTFGVWVLVFLTSTTILGLTWLFFHQTKIPWMWQPVLLIIFSLFFVYFINGRANTADVIILLGFLNIIFRMKPSPVFKKVVSLLGLTFLFSVLWINIHFTGVLGIILFPLIVWVCFASEAKLIEKLGVCVSVAFTALVGTFLTPFGFTVYEKLFFVQDASTNIITEWGPLIQQGQVLYPHVFIVVAGLLAAIWVGWKERLFLLSSALLVLTVQTITTSRYGLYLAFVVLIAVGFAGWVEPKKKFVVDMLKIGSVMLAVTFLGAGGFLAGRTIVNPDLMFPVSVEALSTIPSGSKVLTTMVVGGVAIFYTPDVLVSADGRNDLIGKDRLVETYSMFFNENDEEVENWFQEYEVDAVVVAPESFSHSTVLMDRLENKWGWEKKVVNGTVIYLKPGS